MAHWATPDVGHSIYQNVGGSKICFRACELWIFLFEVLGAEVDYVESAKYLKAAADQCDSYGELYHGICLLDGKGVQQDAAMAVEYFRRSADQGNAMGQINVGFCYHTGLGVTRNPLPVTARPDQHPLNSGDQLHRGFITQFPFQSSIDAIVRPIPIPITH
jgi:hypothetical protein